MFNMFYHISDLEDRPDLVELFVSTMDFSLYVCICLAVSLRLTY